MILKEPNMIFPESRTFIDTLNNGGIPAFAPGMNLPTASSQTNPDFVANHAIPKGAQQLQEFDEFEDDSDTDEFLYNNENIFEESDFLGIRIGKKAKAKGVVKRAARVEKRAARKAANLAPTLVKNIWDGSTTVPDNLSPQLANNPILPAEPSIFPNAIPPLTGAVSALDEEYPEYQRAVNIIPEGFSPTANFDFSKTEKENKTRRTMLYAGAGIAALVIIVLILKKK